MLPHACVWVIQSQTVIQSQLCVEEAMGSGVGSPAGLNRPMFKQNKCNFPHEAPPENRHRRQLCILCMFLQTFVVPCRIPVEAMEMIQGLKTKLGYPDFLDDPVA